MSNDLRSVSAALAKLVTLVQQGAVEGLEPETGGIQNQLENTSAHGDETGATRASYSVYVVSPANDGSAEVAAGAAAAEAKNPGSGVIETAGEIGQNVLMVATGFTDYLTYIEQRAGEDNVSGTMPAQGARLTQAAARGIRRKLGS